MHLPFYNMCLLESESMERSCEGGEKEREGERRVSQVVVGWVWEYFIRLFNFARFTGGSLVPPRL